MSLAAVLTSAGAARADYSESFCASGAPAPVWGSAPSGASAFGLQDSCAAGYGLDFVLPGGATQAAGTTDGSVLTLPAGLVITGVSMSYFAEPPKSGAPTIQIGYDSAAGAAALLSSPLANYDAEGALSSLTPVPDATGLYLETSCPSSGACTFDSPDVFELFGMTLALHDTTVPAPSGAGGTLLAHGPRRGEQTLGYTVTAAGSGVAGVTLSIGSRTVATASESCQSGALSPCPSSVSGVFTVNTAGLPDGRHPVVLSATNASGFAGNATLGTVLTRNHSGTIELAPALRRLHVKLALAWKWSSRRTTLTRIVVRRLRRGERLSVACRGPRCPFHVRSTGTLGLRRFTRRIRGAHFRPGDRLEVVLTAPRRRAERARLLIRAGRIPRVVR